MRAGEGVIQVQSDDPTQNGRDARNHLDDLRGMGGRGSVTRGTGTGSPGYPEPCASEVAAGWGGWEEAGGGAVHHVEMLRTTSRRE